MAQKYVEVEGLDGLEAAIKHLEFKTAQEHQGAALFEGAKVLERGVKEWIKAWHLIDTNHYRNSIEALRVSNNLSVVFTPVVYSRIHEMGGTIRAKRAPFLVFKIGKQWIRTKSVTMPARPHWRPAIRTKSKMIIKTFGDALMVSINEAARKGNA